MIRGKFKSYNILEANVFVKMFKTSIKYNIKI